MFVNKRVITIIRIYLVKSIFQRINYVNLDLDHTADVQLHAWGCSIKDAFENIVPCMFNYMTDLSMFEINPNKTIEIDVKGSFFFFI